MKKYIEIIKQKKILSSTIVFGILLVFIVVFVFVNNSSKTGKQTQENTQTTEEDELTLEDLQESEVQPTVDSSVKVDLEAQNYNREVILTISGIPNETENIEYELSYFAKGDLPKGAIGNIDLASEKVKNSLTRTITLGTCSSGTCVYDEGVESVTVTLKFNGSYGARLFKKEYTL